MEGRLYHHFVKLLHVWTSRIALQSLSACSCKSLLKATSRQRTLNYPLQRTLVFNSPCSTSLYFQPLFGWKSKLGPKAHRTLRFGKSFLQVLFFLEDFVAQFKSGMNCPKVD